MKREEVYAILDGERNYQDQRWGGQAHDRVHSLGDWLTYMDDYLQEAKKQLSREPDATAVPKALATIRKITAMGVACMEAHGAPPRGAA